MINWMTVYVNFTFSCQYLFCSSQIWYQVHQLFIFQHSWFDWNIGHYPWLDAEIACSGLIICGLHCDLVHFKSVVFHSRCDPIVTQDCCNLSFYSYIEMMLYYSGPPLAVTGALCCRWYLKSILLWPYWFGCQCRNGTVRATTPCPVCMAHSFLTRPWFHQLWMRYTAAAFIFSSSRSL